jgi:hypothetical protein
MFVLLFIEFSNYKRYNFEFCGPRRRSCVCFLRTIIMWCRLYRCYVHFLQNVGQYILVFNIGRVSLLTCHNGSQACVNVSIQRCVIRMCAHTKILKFHLLTANIVYSIYSVAESFSLGKVCISSDLAQYYMVHFINKWECTFSPIHPHTTHTHTHTHTQIPIL